MKDEKEFDKVSEMKRNPRQRNRMQRHSCQRECSQYESKNLKFPGQRKRDNQEPEHQGPRCHKKDSKDCSIFPSCYYDKALEPKAAYTSRSQPSVKGRQGRNSGQEPEGGPAGCSM